MYKNTPIITEIVLTRFFFNFMIIMSQGGKGINNFFYSVIFSVFSASSASISIKAWRNLHATSS